MAQNSTSFAVNTPTAGQVRRVFERLAQTTDQIVCVHVSGTLIDAAEVVERASRPYAGRQRIVVVDALTTSVGLGLIVEAAARAATDAGAIARGRADRPRHGPAHVSLFFSDSLEYLEAWGRLGSAQTMGTMLNLKPLSTMENSDLLPIEKVRTYQRAVEQALPVHRRVLAHRADVPAPKRLRN